MPKFVRRGREFWAQVIGEFEGEGAVEPHQEFVDRHGVECDSFRRWLYRFRAERQGRAWRGRHRRRTQKVAAVPWPLVEVQSGPVADGRFEVDLPRGRRLRVPASFEAEALRHLLAILDEEPAR